MRAFCVVNDDGEKMFQAVDFLCVWDFHGLSLPRLTSGMQGKSFSRKCLTSERFSVKSFSTMKKQFVLGTELRPAVQRQALACFVHRFTGQHKPAWASKPWKDGKHYPVQFKDDAEWLANTLFEVREDGGLCGGECRSHPTWPNNPEQRRFFLSSDRLNVIQNFGKEGIISLVGTSEADAQSKCDELNADWRRQLLAYRGE